VCAEKRPGHQPIVQYMFYASCGLSGNAHSTE
jgi:hypothetical protein